MYFSASHMHVVQLINFVALYFVKKCSIKSKRKERKKEICMKKPKQVFQNMKTSAYFKRISIFFLFDKMKK